MKVFISKNLNEVVELQAFCQEKGWPLNAVSLIETHFNPGFNLPEKYEVICFGSPKAVKIFCSKFSILPTARIACVGQASARTLESFGYKTQFAGKNSGDTKQVAEELKLFVGPNDRCFFPVSNISLGSLHHLFSASQKLVEILYLTVEKSLEIVQSDVYIFTSPSNLDSFLKQNTIPPKAIVVAWGKTTAQKLISLQITPQYTLEEASVREAVHILSQLTFLD